MTGTARPWVRRTTMAGAGLVLLLMAALSAGPATAAARPLSTCTATTGAIIAVDFAHWGGPVLRSCGSTPTTGYVLLNQGGWETTGTEHDGPEFICRIGYSGYRHGAQYPTASHDACVQTPSATAYWASWLAGPGQNSWSYSQYGAMSTHPRPGSVVLWVFGGTNVAGTTGSALPPVSPNSLRAQQATGETTANPVAIVNAPPAAVTVSASHGSARPTIIAAAIALLALAGMTAAARRRRIRQS
jgi:hypothetical protein